MSVLSSSRVLSLRVGPGGDLIEALTTALDDVQADGAAVVTAIGSLEFLRYAVVTIDDTGVPRYTTVIEETGAIEITSIQGHLGREDDATPTAHLHGTFALTDGSVRAGHVYGARALVTVEITLLVSDQLRWQRRHEVYKQGKQMPILLPQDRSTPGP